MDESVSQTSQFERAVEYLATRYSVGVGIQVDEGKILKIAGRNSGHGDKEAMIRRLKAQIDLLMHTGMEVP